MLCNSLASTMAMWDPQLKAFEERFRVVRYDRRGHGSSGVTPPPYSMELLARDALVVMDGLSLAKVNWLGLSMGGMVGQWLGANAPQRIDRLILSNTSSYVADKDGWNQRLQIAREKGMGPIAEATMTRWFTPGFIAREPATIAKIKAMVASTPLDGFIGCASAVRDMDHRELLQRITAPTLVIAGRHDAGTPPEAGEFIRDRVPGAKFVLLDAAHLSNVEVPEKYTETVLGFLNAN
jgi:3-oxoadipate enol-lactonase